jgi:hypothetical protein
MIARRGKASAHAEMALAFDPIDPIEKICVIVMTRFARANRLAKTGPLADARALLGERYLDVAVEAMRKRTKDALWGAGKAASLEAAQTCGDVGARSVIVGIVSDAISDILLEAGGT